MTAGVRRQNAECLTPMIQSVDGRGGVKVKRIKPGGSILFQNNLSY